MIARLFRPAPLAVPLVLCLLCLALPALAAGAEPLVLNAANTAPRVRPDGTGFEDRIVAEAFRRVGVPVRLIVLPSERAMQNANQGVDDGNYVRIAGLERSYPNLVMVPEPVSQFLFTAFTLRPDVDVRSWNDLGRYHVGIITGWKIVEANTAGISSVTRARDEKSLFELLASGRAEVVVCDRYTGLEMARLLGLSGVRALSPALETRDMFIYLHRRHAALVPRLAEALRAMRQDGTIDRLTREGLAKAGPEGGAR